MTHTISFARKAHLLYGTPPVQNARGEIVLSFVDIGTQTFQMQPLDRELRRELHGIVVEIAWVGFVMGSTTVRPEDRCLFLGDHLEVVQVSPWEDHVEVEFREVGR